jgi:alcohol/geraniol dehydrogenase (NADP+)
MLGRLDHHQVDAEPRGCRRRSGEKSAALATSGPLYCGGITVFNPIVRNGITGTHRVGVVGIGGLGHLALRFLDAWGCEVTAFSTSADKEEEAHALGADHFVNTREEGALARLAGFFDMILVTVNVGALDWESYLAALRPRGKLHFVGHGSLPVRGGLSADQR